jgi:hypothetical protein
MWALSQRLTITNHHRHIPNLQPRPNLHQTRKLLDLEVIMIVIKVYTTIMIMINTMNAIVIIADIIKIAAVASDDVAALIHVSVAPDSSKLELSQRCKRGLYKMR